jgi:hypothetical protein
LASTVGKDEWVLVDKATGEAVLNTDKTIMAFKSEEEAIAFREKYGEHISHHDVMTGEELYQWTQR